MRPALRATPAILLAAAAVALGAARVGPTSALAQTATAERSQTFRNPILAQGADPSVAYADGFYHLVQSDQDGITVRTSLTLSGLAQARKKRVFAPGSQGSPCCEWWAPEIVTLDGKWYIYVAADDGHNENHRTYVLESDKPDGQYAFKGKISATTDKWAIDATAYPAPDGQRYLIWSGWEGDVNVAQNLYIAHLKNPWTIEGERALISQPTEVWEKRGGNGVTLPFINEGPEVLQRGGRTFLAYSASGSWSNDYCLGLLTLTGKDPMQRASWTKSSDCVFQTNPKGAWAPGHNNFTTSPDGSEVWHLYHANEIKGSSWGGRSIRAQKVNFRPDGTPDFGTPVTPGTPVALPSGEYEAEDARLNGTTPASRDFASGGAAVLALKPGASVGFEKVNAPAAGQYVLRAHYSNAGAAGAQTVKVNGQGAGTVNYASTGSWETYGTAKLNVALQARENTIVFAGQSGDAQLDAVTVAAR